MQQTHAVYTYFQKICKTTAASVNDITTAVLIVGFSSKYTDDKI